MLVDRDGNLQGGNLHEINSPSRDVYYLEKQPVYSGSVGIFGYV